MQDSNNSYRGPERRQFLRLDYTTPLSYKVCKQETISKLMSGYIQDISSVGLRCKLDDGVPKNSILWLCFDRGTLDLCAELEKKSVILQSGILGKVVWVRKNGARKFNVGVRFVTREEKDDYTKYYHIR